METNTTKSARLSRHWQQFIYWFRQLSSLKRFAVVFMAIILLLYVGWLVQFFWPRSVVLSYSEPTCTSSLIPLPTLYQSNGSDLHIGLVGGSSERWLTHEVCVYPMRTPVPGDDLNATVSLRWLPWFGQRIAMEVPPYPELLLSEQSEPVFVATTDELELSFSGEDQLFSYELALASDASSLCQKNAAVLRCDLAPLELAQATEYELHLNRLFEELPVERLATKQVRTLSPLELVESSIEHESTVYDKPDRIELRFDKQLRADQLPKILVSSDDDTIDSSYEINEETLHISFTEDLPREALIELSISELMSQQGAMLDDTISLQFTTSGGPAVSSSNVTTGVSQQAVIEVTFDQPLQEDIDINDIASLQIGGNEADARVTIDGATLRFQPRSSWQRCGIVTLAIEGELMSNYGVPSRVLWRTEGRITCRHTEQIGRSVQGRPILAHHYGSGSNTILYVGGMHGNEYSSVILMERWLEELDRNPDRIPNNKTLIIIPESCPDCVVARSRLNANRVDLNRNFPTDDWQSEVYIPGPTHLSKGGGDRALSEPEAAALAALVRRERPILTLTYHAVADVVISNDAGRSVQWGREYARLSGYDFSTTNDIENVFNYQATGAFEDWIKDELNLPALLVELSTMASDEMQRNRDALWYTTRL